MNIDSKVTELNNVLTDVILKSCEGKDRILTTLTAGMDTRVILSILLNNGIYPFCVTYNGWDNFGMYKDIKISRKIARFYQLTHIIINKQPNDTDFYLNLCNVLQDYDVVFYGEKMTEIFNKYNRITDSERKLNELELSVADYPSKVYPALNKKVRDIVKDIPIYYRMHGYLQRKLITMNQEALLYFPHTYYNLKYVIAEKLHKLSLRVI